MAFDSDFNMSLRARNEGLSKVRALIDLQGTPLETLGATRHGGPPSALLSADESMDALMTRRLGWDDWDH